jgi:hypothetical protein
MTPTGGGKGLRIGELLVSKKILTPHQVELILDYSRERGLRFGEAGMELGFLSRESFVRLFSPSSDIDLFQLQPKYFPQQTKNLFDVETILRFGVLPLGSRVRGGFFGSRKIINLGFLTPRKTEVVQEVKNRVLSQQRGADGKAEKIDFRVFLILADQFLAVMESVYGFSEERVMGLSQDKLDPTLKMFLEMEDGAEDSAPPA